MRADVRWLFIVFLLMGCGGSRVLRQRSGDIGGAAQRVPVGTALLRGSAEVGTRQAMELDLLGVHAFENLLISAGLEDVDELPVHHNPFTPEDAVEVLGRLMEAPVTLRAFPPRMAAGFLLREVLARGEVSREELVRRVARFAREQVAVLRPDGYLAWALDGTTQQKVAPVEWKDGAFRAGHFELGRFYSGRRGVFRHTDAQLRSVEGPPLAEVYDDADVINRSLDGAEDAFGELYHALGQLLSRPTDSLAGLRHLPAGLVALIASSPDYWERFQNMTRGEQIREAARLTTNVIMLWGTASAATRTLTRALASTEATVPLLSLSSAGGLGVERIAVPVGHAAAVLSGGPGAAIILQRVDDAASSDAAQGDGSLEASTSSGPKAYSSYKSFRRALGPAGEGKEWHHVVEQTDGNVARFGPKAIHNTENIIPIDKELHGAVSSFYSSKRRFLTGSDTLTVRQWLGAQPFETQRAFGLRVIENIGKGIWR